MKIKFQKQSRSIFLMFRGITLTITRKLKKKADGLKKEEPSKDTSRSEAKDEKSLPIIDEKESLRANKK